SVRPDGPGNGPAQCTQAHRRVAAVLPADHRCGQRTHSGAGGADSLAAGGRPDHRAGPVSPGTGRAPADRPPGLLHAAAGGGDTRPPG
nr:hypothetical protein [Tanacetum cinerariifolium]